MKYKGILIIGLCTLLFPVLAEPIDEGKEIFLNRCGMCHAYPDPSALNATQWKFVLKKMQKRMDFKGIMPLTVEQNEKVYEYLSRMAKTKK